MSANFTRVADRFLQARVERQMGVNVSSWDDRYKSPYTVAGEWMMDWDDLVRKYWSMQRIRSATTGKHTWYELRAGGKDVVIWVSEPQPNVSVKVSEMVPNAAQRELGKKNFPSSASLWDILMWIDKTIGY